MDFIWSSGLTLSTGCAACVPGGVCVWWAFSLFAWGLRVVLFGFWLIDEQHRPLKRGLIGNLGFTFKYFPACHCFAWREGVQTEMRFAVSEWW